MLQTIQNRLIYEKAKKCRDQHETQDLCGELAQRAPMPKSTTVPTDLFAVPDPEFTKQRTLREGTAITGGGKVLKRIKGMGTIYDWRGTNWSRPNGGIIKPIIFVQHIPVVPNAAGIADFVRLRDVLVRQGLMVQNATDRDGNIALFTEMNRMCYQARGANQFSCGTEHMHMTTAEDWTKKQLRASAWLVNQANLKHGIPLQNAKLIYKGGGIARVSRRGQCSHQAVSSAAGYHDRTDPGAHYDWQYVEHCVHYYREHGHFERA